MERWMVVVNVFFYVSVIIGFIAIESKLAHVNRYLHDIEMVIRNLRIKDDRGTVYRRLGDQEP